MYTLTPKTHLDRQINPMVMTWVDQCYAEFKVLFSQAE